MCNSLLSWCSSNFQLNGVTDKPTYFIHVSCFFEITMHILCYLDTVCEHGLIVFSNTVCVFNFIIQQWRLWNFPLWIHINILSVILFYLIYILYMLYPHTRLDIFIWFLLCEGTMFLHRKRYNTWIRHSETYIQHLS